MTPVPNLGKLLGLETIIKYDDQKDWFVKRDEIKKLIGDWLINKNTQEWLDVLQPADIWCSEVLEWDKLLQDEGFKVLDMIQEIKRPDGLSIQTLRCPIRIDNQISKSSVAAPKIGENTMQISEEFSL